MNIVALGGPIYRVPTMPLSMINSFLFLEADGSVTLVDAGLSSAPKRIVAGLAELGKHPRDVQRIILTHAHYDHAGGAAQLVADSSAPGVAAHEADAEYLRQGVNPPGDPKSLTYRVFLRNASRGFQPVVVSEALEDGHVLDVAGGLQVHHTPGHTPGHVSLLHPDTGVLITGDAIFNFGIRIAWPFAAACTSLPLNRKSAQVFADLDYRLAAFTHGPEIRDQARERVRAFVSTHS